MFERPCCECAFAEALVSNGRPQVELELARQGQTRRKAGTQSYRSNGVTVYDSGVATHDIDDDIGRFR